ncbi:hypothetical protein F5Y18DRAFT_440973 [Xylariaceae sp. FL1019]|nr:hypothetical protein F5Y18DRAFT_440973 [Xylariaceae sp. FL1019]
MAGLLSLPPEIRDQIYHVILHPNNNRTVQADEYTDYSYRDAVVLFRLNRLIYREARDVFRTMTGTRASRFNGHSLSVVIETPSAGPPPDGMQHFVFLADDLPAFTRAWYYWDLSHPGLNQWLSLKLHLRDPNAAEWDEPHVRRDIQRRLLLPWGMVKSLRDFTLTGNPTPQPKIESEMRALQAVAPPSPEQSLTEGIRLKNEGNILLQKGDARGALRVYSRAWEAIHIVIRGRQRHVHAEAYYAKELSEPFPGRNGQMERLNLRVQLVANTCLAYLKLGEWEELKFWGMRTIQLISHQHDDRPIEPEDEAILDFPFATQIGKIYYRTASACKALGERSQAHRLLKVAAIYLPRDETVRKDLAATSLQLG